MLTSCRSSKMCCPLKFSHQSVFLPKNAEIIRSRDPEQLASCDIVVDVGGVYDPKQHRYDHHQRYLKIIT